MKRGNSGDLGPSAKRLKPQTVDEFVKDGGAAEREIFLRLRRVSLERKDHELWTYFDRPRQAALEAKLDDLSLTTYKDLKAKLLASEARKLAANAIAKVNNANPMEAFVSGAANGSSGTKQSARDLRRIAPQAAAKLAGMASSNMNLLGRGARKT